MWLGKGLKLGEFLQLPAGERRARFYELADVDQLLFVERNLDPFVALMEGYLGRMRSRAMKDWNQDFWWEPGAALPERSPDLSAAVGE